MNALFSFVFVVSAIDLSEVLTPEFMIPILADPKVGYREVLYL